MKKFIIVLLCLFFLQPVFASFSSDIESTAKQQEYFWIKKEDLEKLFNLSWLIYDMNKKLGMGLNSIYWDIKNYNLPPTQSQKLSLEQELKILKDKIDLLEKKILKLELDKLSEGL